MFAAIDERRFEEFPRYFHPDIVYLRPGFEPVEGLDALVHFYRHVRLIRSGAHRVERLVADGAAAVAMGTFSGELRDGSPTKEPFADAYEFRDGLVAERRTFFFRPAI
jgi:ketosteroid isomerase-like protein